MSGSETTQYGERGEGAFIENVENETDYLNLRTYDMYDYFILIFAVLLFGLICLMVGCLWNKHLMRKRFIAMSEVDDGVARQNEFQNRDKFPIKSHSLNHKSNGNISFSHKSNPNVSYSHKSFGKKSTNNHRRIEIQERQQLSPKGLRSDEDGEIEIAVSYDRYHQ
mmetsp:Transcript_28256/g.24964  ORF Transcript_28256/g.24964 Transcript_28256/m.24964 type:complete len:166 (+) Transcript_28256:87-584(+)